LFSGFFYIFTGNQDKITGKGGSFLKSFLPTQRTLTHQHY